MRDAVDQLADHFGILPGYADLDGRRHRTSRDTKIAILAAMGVAADTPRSAAASLAAWLADEAEGKHATWQVTTADRAPRLAMEVGDPWQIELEDGEVAEGRGPADLPELPLGRHLLTRKGRRTWLLSAPRKLPRPPRAWGMTAPLAGLHTMDEGGIGSYRDLGEAAVVLGEIGAAFLGINPVHAGFPEDLSLASPYSPSHRRWLNTLHIDTGAAPTSKSRMIDYPVEIRAQKDALSAAYAADPEPEGLSAFREKHGPGLIRFATHQALSEKHGPYWSDWPVALQRHDSRAVAQFVDDNSDEIAFHVWAQFQADRQLGQAAETSFNSGMAMGLYLDLAVGTHPDGAETWENPALFAKGASIGAPPDAFAPEGQDWSLAPMIPRALESEGFATLAAILRQQLRFAKLLRIDHILGFERSFWTTLQPGVAGAYVKMPRAAMLAVARIEAARAGATIIGEDLGNIPKGLRSSLRASGLLGCRLVMFERDAEVPERPKAAPDYDANALASFSTHDLPTWRGWQSGADVKARHRIGQIDDGQVTTELREREADVKSLKAHLGRRGMHEFLADTASDLVAVQIEDVFEVEDQPNLPGTFDEYPNWRLRLPVAVKDYATDRRLDTVAEIMNTSGRRTTP